MLKAKAKKGLRLKLKAKVPEGEFFGDRNGSKAKESSRLTPSTASPPN
jgi:hypothetical protein